MVEKTSASKLNIADHRLVPKHVKLDEKETEKVLEKYNIAKKQLPQISKADPAIKEFEPKPGDVIRIERDSPTVGKVYFYRVVANA
jgi:DNA-directed RNA polymerase subunit H